MDPFSVLAGLGIAAAAMLAGLVVGHRRFRPPPGGG